MLRLKDKESPEGPYKTYTPNELYNTDRATLTQLYSNKKNALMQQNKAGAKEEIFKVGDTVRVIDFAKRKGELTKGFRVSWSRDLYTIFKIKRPKKSEESRPTKFYVKDKETGEQKNDNNGLPIPYTVNDLQKIRGEVQKAPDDIQVVDKDTAVTRGTKKEPPKPEVPKKKKAVAKVTKPKAAPKVDPLLGRRVRSWKDVPVGKSGKTKEVTIYGKVVSREKRKGSSTWKYKIEWEDGEREKKTAAMLKDQLVD